MRDDSHLDHHGDVGFDAQPARVGWTHALGGVLALALLGGAIVWTYRLGTRDPAEVPVIRAAAGGHKVRPDDPGGAVFAHQGLGVYAAMRGTATDAEEIAFAPPPEPLAEEDAAAAALLPEPPAPAPATQDDEAVALPEGASEIDLLVAALEAEAARPAVAPPPAGATPPAVDADPLAPLAAPVAPPRPRPVAAAPASAPAVPPAGAAAVQLGAYPSEEVAQGMLAGIRRRAGDVIAGREVATSPIPRGDRILVGLRVVGFADAAEARALCAALKAKGEDCFVTLP